MDGFLYADRCSEEGGERCRESRRLGGVSSKVSGVCVMFAVENEEYQLGLHGRPRIGWRKDWWEWDGWGKSRPESAATRWREGESRWMEVHGRMGGLKTANGRRERRAKAENETRGSRRQEIQAAWGVSSGGRGSCGKFRFFQQSCSFWPTLQLFRRFSWQKMTGSVKVANLAAQLDGKVLLQDAAALWRAFRPTEAGFL
jgi:hypothetical protein